MSPFNLNLLFDANRKIKELKVIEDEIVISQQDSLNFIIFRMAIFRVYVYLLTQANGHNCEYVLSYLNDCSNSNGIIYNKQEYKLSNIVEQIYLFYNKNCILLNNIKDSRQQSHKDRVLASKKEFIKIINNETNLKLSYSDEITNKSLFNLIRRVNLNKRYEKLSFEIENDCVVICIRDRNDYDNDILINNDLFKYLCSDDFLTTFENVTKKVNEYLIIENKILSAIVRKFCNE